jgi:hypothetical protein
MKTFKNLVEGLKKTKRLNIAGNKRSEQDRQSFTTFHNIMGTNPIDRIASSMNAENPADAIYAKANKGIIKMMLRGSKNPEKADLHARNVVSALYPEGNVRNYATKINKVKAAIAAIKPGDRNIEIPMI